jgi:hypothetical protein
MSTDRRAWFITWCVDADKRGYTVCTYFSDQTVDVYQAGNHKHMTITTIGARS